MNEPMNLLRRKAEIICKLHRKEESYPEIVAQLAALLQREPNSESEEIIKGKEIAMYMFELLTEFHLPQEQIVENQTAFMGLFSESLKDKQARVRAATFKAMTKFLTSIEDEDLVLQYKSQMNGLLDIVVEVLQKDEEQGKESLETLIELTSTFGEIWNDSTEKLIFVCSEVMKNTDFEDGPR